MQANFGCLALHHEPSGTAWNCSTSLQTPSVAIYESTVANTEDQAHGQCREALHTFTFGEGKMGVDRTCADGWDSPDAEYTGRERNTSVVRSKNRRSGKVIAF